MSIGEHGAQRVGHMELHEDELKVVTRILKKPEGNKFFHRLNGAARGPFAFPATSGSGQPAYPWAERQGWREPDPRERQDESASPEKRKALGRSAQGYKTLLSPLSILKKAVSVSRAL